MYKDNAVHELNVVLYKGDSIHELRVIRTRLEYEGIIQCCKLNATWVERYERFNGT